MKMLRTVFKNLFSKSSTRLYPFKKREPFKDVRGELYNDIDDCIFCGICARKCPSNCITVDKAKGLWECDPLACVYCGVCVDVCPKKCLHQKSEYRGVTDEREVVSMKGEAPKPKKKPDIDIEALKAAKAAKKAAAVKEAEAETEEKAEIKKPVKKTTAEKTSAEKKPSEKKASTKKTTTKKTTTKKATTKKTTTKKTTAKKTTKKSDK